MSETKINLKPFDLERGKAGDPVITRDGRKGFVVAVVRECLPNWRVIAYIEGQGSVLSFSETGRFNGQFSHACDLFMAPKKQTMWMQRYQGFGNATVYAACGASASFAQSHAISMAGANKLIGEPIPFETEE